MAKEDQSIERQQRAEKSLYTDLHDKKGTYTLESRYTNWYQALPYCFKILNRDNKAEFMFLPINPSNLSITTHFATNVTATLYGTIEEHSEQRYFDIVIAGTTGMSPKHAHPITNRNNKGQKNKNSKVQPNSRYLYDDSFRRDSFPVKTTPLGGVGQSFLGPLKNILGTATAAVGAIGTLFGAGSETSPEQTGVIPESSGYTAFHNLYRFFLKHKKDTSGEENPNRRKSGHPLTFLNYKDNNQYDVSIQRFVMKRNADNPLLYSYEIVLRAYNLQTIFGNGTREVNSSDLKARLDSLGLGSPVDSNSFFNKTKKASKSVKDFAGSIRGVVGNIFGGF